MVFDDFEDDDGDDATDFDVVDYINSKFPNERSLPRLKPCSTP